jgi:hypothetical protein
MKSSEALRRARRLIYTGREKFVCRALSQVGAQGTDVARRLEKLFSSTNGGFEVLDVFLVITYPSFEDYTFGINWRSYNRLMREYRLAWIDWMIEGYEAVGD